MPIMVPILDAARISGLDLAAGETSRVERRWLMDSIIQGIARARVTFWQQAVIC